MVRRRVHAPSRTMAASTRDHPSRRACGAPQDEAECFLGARLRGLHRLAFENLDRDALRPADEADAHTRPRLRDVLGELDTLALELGGNRIEVVDGEPEMLEPLVGDR